MSWRGCVCMLAWAVSGAAWGQAESEAARPEEPAVSATSPKEANSHEAAPAVTQEAPAAAQTVVTGSRRPERLGDALVATEVITRADIMASGARDASELLSAQPGLQVVQTFAGSELHVQGLGAEYVLVLVDGERVAGRVAGSVDLSRLSMEDIEQVEIVKGPSSVLYGSDAVAGVVNFITRRAHKPLGGELRASYGGLNYLDLDATGEARGDVWGLRLSGGFQRRDAYDLDAVDVATSGSSLDGFQLSARADRRGEGPMTLEATASFARRTQRGVDLSAGGAIFDRASRDDTATVHVAPTWKLSDSANLRIESSYTHFKRRYLLDQRRSTALDSVEDTRDQQGQLGAQVDAQLGESHALVAGAEFLGEWLLSDRIDAGRGRRSRGSVYAQDGWTLERSTKLTLVPGARFDADSRFGSAVTPRLAARMEPLSWLTLRGSYGWAYRAPSFQEMLLDFENPSVGYTVRGNPDLKPEHSRSLSFSVEVRPVESSLLWASVFQHNLRDMITATLVEDGETQRYSYVNITRARVRGGELGVRQKLPWRLSAELGYTLTDGRSEETGLALEGQARHRFTAQATWRHRETGLEAFARASVVGKRPFYSDLNGNGLEDDDGKAYVTLDARVAWQLRSEFQVFVLGTNLLDTGDPLTLPIPPRTVQAGISARL